ncbi:hypothetical protein C447_15811 [Halococcus hamelinensis 100A6]|uniref:Uncharacterized protein n=1 Tax=Halococcus hamelinensis 100A6 TaxID=1132509 RepID=M0LSV9_9EURY|nr:hypothetical protein C447_15811 [Halococcus hamelinensis 100A6]
MVIQSGREKIRDGSHNIQVGGSLGNTAGGGGFDEQNRTGGAETESHERALTVAIVAESVSAPIGLLGGHGP